jgi:lambda family phage portal protein
MAAVVSAMFTVFIKTEKAEGIDTIQSPEISTSAEMAALNGLAPPSSRDAFKLAPGAMLDLLQGEDVEFANPTRPNAQFDPFTVAIWKQIGAALEVPYEIILKFFGQSYSASRAAFVLAWKFFQGRRDWLAWGFCQPFWNAVITEAVARGRLSAPGFFSDPLIRAAWCGAQWTGPPAGQIDPESEANAAEKWIELEVKTRQEVTAEITGGDWETKHRQRAREEKMRVADGLSVDPNAAPAQGGDPPPAPKRDSRASRERKQEISA